MSVKCPKCNSDNADTAKFCSECATPLPAHGEVSVTKTLETPIKKLTTGTKFADRYEILEELGKGGMGEVYRVKDEKLDEEMALKVLKPEIAVNKDMIERFKNELKFARKIAHRKVCKMYDLNEEEETPYITMEYVKGEDLKNYIRKKERLTEEEVIDIAKQVCEGLAEAHELGVVHRDLKPQNIMIDKKNNAKVMDFGIARSVETSGVTKSGVMIGTPDYMSPEQAEGEEADKRSDIYALGVIMYEMVTGSVPFKGDTAFSVALKHKTKLPSNPKKINPEVSENLSRLILVCMEKERERRYQTSEALLADLRNIEDGLPLGTKLRPRRETFVAALIRKKLFIPSLVVSLAIIAVAIWHFFPHKAAVVPKIENSIAVISFENLTGNESHDILQRTIPNLLITNLENTGYLNVATWERLRDLLKQMGKEEVESIDQELGFELCRREGIEAIVLGSVQKFGNVFATDIKVFDVETKEFITSASSKGEGEDSIINTQIAELSKKITLGVGIVSEEIESAELNISDFTTTSIEAYNYFIRGRDDWYYQYYNDATRYLEKAVEIDPDFAMAYLYLGAAYSNLGEINRARESFDNAKSLSEGTTEKERLTIEAEYAFWVDTNYEEYFQIYKTIVEKHPRDKRAHWELSNYYGMKNMYPQVIEELEIVLELDPNWADAYDDLAFAYSNIGEDEKALEYIKKGLSVIPGDPNMTDAMGHFYMKTGNLDEALAKFKDVLDIKPDFNNESSIAYVYAMKEDYSEAFKWIDQFIASAPSEGKKVMGYLFKGFYHLWLGNSNKAFDDIQKAENLCDEVGDAGRKAVCANLMGRIYYEREELDLSQDQWQRWFEDISKNFPERTSSWEARTHFRLGLIDLKRRNIDSVKSRLKKIEDLMPKLNEPQMTFRYKLILGEVLLSENFYDEAISVLDDVKQIKMPWFFEAHQIINRNLLLINTDNILARVYKEKGDLDKAIAVYEQLTDSNPENREGYLIYPKNYYRLARLYEQKGRRSKAIEHYEKFLDLWKDADPGVSEVEDAKKRLAGLRD